MHEIYRIIEVLKVKTDTIASIAVSLIWQAVILEKMYGETFKTEVIVFIDVKHHNVTSHW